MDAPKCKNCGVRELNHVCGGSVSLSNLPSVPEAEVENCPVCGASLKAKERRREYMRNYMQIRRANNV